MHGVCVTWRVHDTCMARALQRSTELLWALSFLVEHLRETQATTGASPKVLVPRPPIVPGARCSRRVGVHILRPQPVRPKARGSIVGRLKFGVS